MDTRTVRHHYALEGSSWSGWGDELTHGLGGVTSVEGHTPGLPGSPGDGFKPRPLLPTGILVTLGRRMWCVSLLLTRGCQSPHR